MQVPWFLSIWREPQETLWKKALSQEAVPKACWSDARPKPGTQRRLRSLRKVRVPFYRQKLSHIQRQERKYLRSVGCYVTMSGKKKGSAPRLSRGSLTQKGALPPAREKYCPKMGLQHWEPVFVTRSGMLNQLSVLLWRGTLKRKEHGND